MKVSSCSFVFLHVSLFTRHLSIMIQQLLSDQSSESVQMYSISLMKEEEREKRRDTRFIVNYFKYYVAFSYEDQEPNLE